jgi:hypothetical protein
VYNLPPIRCGSAALDDVIAEEMAKKAYRVREIANSHEGPKCRYWARYIDKTNPGKHRFAAFTRYMEQFVLICNH